MFDIATYGATYYDEKSVVKCFQLDGHSKIGWIYHDTEGKFKCDILTLEKGKTRIETINVGLNSPRNHFWLPIW